MSNAATPETEVKTAEQEKEERRNTPGLCVGRCNRRWIEHGTGSLSYGDPVLCQRCISQTRTSLLEIESAAAIAAASADGHRASVSTDDSPITMHRGASEMPSPSPLFDDMDEMVSCFRGWMAIKRPRAARLGFLAREMTEVIDWLVFHLPDFTDNREHAARFFEDVASWHGRMIGAGKAGTPLFSKPLPCPRCRLIALTQERGSDVVKCSECGRMMSAHEYDDLAAEADAASKAGSEPSPAPRGKKSKTAA